MILIVSDFYEEPGALASALRRLRYDHHEVIGLHVLDPGEKEFDLDQAGTFLDVENGARCRLDASSVRRGYLARFQAFCAELDETFRAVGGETARMCTDRAPVEILSRYLAGRARRL